MSLIQHVTQIDGTDREEALVDLFLPPLERYASIERAAERRLSIESGFLRPGSVRTVRRVISYDALKPPEEPPVENGGVTQYTVSKRIRVGKPLVLICFYHCRQTWAE